MSKGKQKMHYRLALDLGSTSLGWAMLRLNAQGEPYAIIKAGVRIFSDGRNPKDGSSLAVSRRAARAMRRRRDRLLKRKHRMMDLLIRHGFFPADEQARKQLESLNPYQLRAEGLNRALTPGEFARALFHINQRRGFKSNRKTDKGESDSGALKTAIANVREQLAEQGSRTVGEWLWQRMQRSAPVRARYREERVAKEDGKTRIEKSYDLYIDRAMIEAEFDALWSRQAELNPALFTDAAGAALKDALLFQRPLRPVKPGRCTLLPDEERAPLALPSTQRFRIYQEVNHLRLLDDDLREVALTLPQRDAVVAALESRQKMTFEQIRKLLKLSGSDRFNLEDEKRKELKGNATSAILGKKELFGAAWGTFSHELQDEIVWQLVNEQSEATLIAWLQQHTGVDEALAQAIANVSLPEGYGSLSRKALARIVPALREPGDDGLPRTYDKAVQAAGFAHHSDLGFNFEHSPDEVAQVGERVIAATGEIKPVVVFRELPYYGRALQRHVAFGSGKPEDPEEKRYGKITNPTVHIGLNQVRVVVNALIRRYGHPAEIVVELARELKLSREKKLETQRQQAENQKRNERIRATIAQTLKISEERVRRADIQKWILWEELSFDVAERRCPYSGVQISAAMLLGDEVEIEHILPFSQTLDDSLNNKTVAMRKANRIKGNRTPWQAREDFEKLGWSYDGILLRAGRMPLRKRYRFAPDGYEHWLGSDKDFLARALNDTRYLSRVAVSYLRLICPQDTRVIPGQMTGMLRAKFGLNGVLGLDGEKNRNDHRHHAVDACVIGVTDQGMFQRFAQASASAVAEDRQATAIKETDETLLHWPTYFDHVKRAVENIQVSHRPDHGYEGAMHNETAYGLRGDGRVSVHKIVDGKRTREESALKVITMTDPLQNKRHGLLPNGEPRPYKGYKGDSNYCIEIVRDEKGKWQGEVISTFQAYQFVRSCKTPKEGFQRLRHPTLSLSGKSLVMRLMIDDYVRLALDDRIVTMRVASINSAGRLSLAEHFEANVDARNRATDGDWRYTYKQAGSLQKARARRITISPIGVLRDPGFRE